MSAKSKLIVEMVQRSFKNVNLDQCCVKQNHKCTRRVSIIDIFVVQNNLIVHFQCAPPGFLNHVVTLSEFECLKNKTNTIWVQKHIMKH